MSKKLDAAMELNEELMQALNRIREETRAKSMADVLRTALGVYYALHDLLKENGPNATLAIINRK